MKSSTRPLAQVRSRGRSSAFTLVEMIMVVAIILFLLSMLIFAAGNAQSRAQIRTTEELIDTIESGLVTYYENNGHYPSQPASGTTAGVDVTGSLFSSLTDPVNGASMISIPSGATLGAGTGRYFVDGWKNPIYCVVYPVDTADKPSPSRKNGGMPLIYSKGPDGIGVLPASLLSDPSGVVTNTTTGGADDDNISNFRDMPSISW
jgi:type II secretory pathway pseudopilin PulG